MLYDMNDENEEKSLVKNEIKNEINISKKIIICCIIILFCIIIFIITLGVKNKFNQDKKNINEEIVQEQSIQQQQEEVNDNISKNNHIQIEKHDIGEIKKQFLPMPKHNPNAQEQITNLYYSDEKVAYLTFDDGPSKNITPYILDILKQENIPATFFVLGSRVELYPDILRREYEEGHYIANHSYSHQYSQIYRSKDTVFEEYIKCENSIRNALGNQEFNTYLFRFPGGSSGGKYAGVKSEAKELLHTYGVNFTNWNCLTGDAEGKTTPEALLEYLKITMQDDGTLIVLMHDASDKTYTLEALPSVIAYLKEQGYTFKNFYEIFK